MTRKFSRTVFDLVEEFSVRVMSGDHVRRALDKADIMLSLRFLQCPYLDKRIKGGCGAER